MNLLGFDSTSLACSVALWREGEIFSDHAIQPRKQAQLLLLMIDAVFKKANLSHHDLHGIAFGQGPGSFTGIRLAASVAQALGFAWQLPLYPVCSLQAMAQRVHEHDHKDCILVAADARMGEVYWATYQWQYGVMRLLSPVQLTAPAQVLAPAFTPWVGVGEAFQAYPLLLDRLKPSFLASTSENIPHAETIAEIAHKMALNKEGVTFMAGLPHYVREQVVKPLSLE